MEEFYEKYGGVVGVYDICSDVWKVCLKNLFIFNNCKYD